MSTYRITPAPGPYKAERLFSGDSRYWVVKHLPTGGTIGDDCGPFVLCRSDAEGLSVSTGAVLVELDEGIEGDVTPPGTKAEVIPAYWVDRSDQLNLELAEGTAFLVEAP